MAVAIVGAAWTLKGAAYENTRLYITCGWIAVLPLLDSVLRKKLSKNITAKKNRPRGRFKDCTQVPADFKQRPCGYCVPGRGRAGEARSSQSEIP